MIVRGWHIYKASQYRSYRQTGISVVPPRGSRLGFFLPLWRWRKLP